MNVTNISITLPQLKHSEKEKQDINSEDVLVDECDIDNRSTCHREAACIKFNGYHQCICVHSMRPESPKGYCDIRRASKPVSSPPILIMHSSKDPQNTRTTPSTPFQLPPAADYWHMMLIAILSSVLVLLGALCILLCWKGVHLNRLFKKKKVTTKQTLISLRKGIIPENRYLSNPEYDAIADSSFLPHLSRSTITNLEEIGEGFFGKVFKGQYHLDRDGMKTIETVAVKMLKQTTEEAEQDFMRELEITSTFQHMNILSLIGFCPRDMHNGPWMVFEFMPFGDLAAVLRNNNHQFWLSNPDLPKLSQESLLSISVQIADGMQYLAKQRFVHRDLACRNCLVGSGLIVKIADFGLSRDVYTCDYYKTSSNRMLPVRWMAPESILYGKFTLESDIWSYGVVLWEIYNFGKQPYFGHTNDEVLEFLLEHKLLDLPKNCPKVVGRVMSECWRNDPKKRMTFIEIRKRLLELKSDHHPTKRPLPRPPPLPIHHNLHVNSEDESLSDSDNIVDPYRDSFKNDYLFVPKVVGDFKSFSETNNKKISDYIEPIP